MSCISEIKIKRGPTSRISGLDVVPNELIVATDTNKLYVGNQAGTKYVPIVGECSSNNLNLNRVGTFEIPLLGVSSSQASSVSCPTPLSGSIITFSSANQTMSTGRAIGSGFVATLNLTGSSGTANIARQNGGEFLFPELKPGESVTWGASSTYGALLGNNSANYVKVSYSAKTASGGITISAAIPSGLTAGEYKLIVPDFSGEVNWNY